MNNFGRAIRLALRYRLTFIASLVCALLVAVTWGGNIGTIYPVFQVAFEGHTLQEWLDDQIESANSELAIVAAERQTIEVQPESRERQLALGDLASRARSQKKTLDYCLAIKPYLDRYCPHDIFLTLLAILGVLIAGTIFKSVFFIGHQILASQLANLAVFDLRKQFYRRTLRMHLASFGENGSSELLSHFTHDMEQVSAGLKALFGKVIREPLKMVACLIGAGWVCWRLLVLTLLVAPVCVWLVNRLARLLKRANRRAMENMSQVYSILEETFQGIKVVKAFTMERYERRRFHQNSKSFYRRAMKIARYDSLTRPATELMGMVIICTALAAGAYLVIKGETHLLGIRLCDQPLSHASLLLFYGFLAGISDPGRKLSEVFNYLQRASAACDRIYALMDREPEVRDPERATPLRRHHREIVFDNISFEYLPGTPVLEGVSLRIPYGETIALVGPNGCGKSTLVNMLPRFFDPMSGIVRVDGIDLRETRLTELRRQIGLVTQETLLFDDTVFNNIRYGSPQARREDVILAAKQAHAHRFIEERLDAGYQTMVGSGGSGLSGGQRQRIALARAILRDPAILILDEATSQIDLESEQLIHQVLEKFTRNRTTFIITHRLSTLALADRIGVMDGGHLLDIGTHDELMRRCPLYSRLHAIQFRESA